MTGGKWYPIHDEALGTPSVTVVIWASQSLGADYGKTSRILFEVNRDGLEICYYQTAGDAIKNQFPIAVSCYGQVTLLAEEDQFDWWLDKVWEEQDSEVVTSCTNLHEGLTCEEVFDEAQKALGNA